MALVAVCAVLAAFSSVASARPARPAKLHATKVTRTTVSIAWRHAGARRAHRSAKRHGHRRHGARRAAVRRFVVWRNGARVAVLRRSRHRYKLRGLHCGRRHRISVRTRDRHGHASRAARISVRTARCAAARHRGDPPPPGGGADASPPSAPPAARTAGHPRVFAYYYLWWSDSHWRKALGSHYPFSASPLPLPARLDASGCNPVANYSGATVTDVPQRLYSQDDPGFIAADVREAAAAGLAGFLVNWAGTGTSSQTATSNPYSKRLRAMVDAVHQVNAQGIPFKLWLSYKASASLRSDAAIRNDLSYFLRTYGNDPAFDRAQSRRPTVVWNGSRKYSLATLRDVSAAFRSRLRIIGDESSWSAARAPYLDGDAYYWSSQNPYSNPHSFSQLRSLAAAVRASGHNPDGSAKAWISPLAPGYDSQLAGGSACTPRKGGETLRRLFAGNAATRPEAWALISWNEITEGTYVDPMTRYGHRDLDVLRSLIAGR